jgi:hypothetical protein
MNAIALDGSISVGGTATIGMQYIKCAKNQSCDTQGPGHPLSLAASCPGGYQIVGCTPQCYDPAGIRDCATDVSATTCNLNCQNLNGGACSGNYAITMICARVN